MNATDMRAAYLDLADNMETIHPSRYARALGAMSADYEECIAKVEEALIHLKDTPDFEWKRNAQRCLREAAKSYDPENLSIPVKRRKKPNQA